MFRINNVYSNQGKKYRILKKLSNDTIVWIAIDETKALPELIQLQSLIDLVEEGECYLIDDPYLYLLLQLPGDGTTAQIKRDVSYEQIETLKQQRLEQLALQRQNIGVDRVDNSIER